MRLANGIVLEKEATFGELKFSALRREVRIQKEDGTLSEKIKERIHTFKSKEYIKLLSEFREIVSDNSICNGE